MVKVAKDKFDEGHWHWCQSCEQLHKIPIIQKEGAGWTFNGNFEKPTFSPSVKLTWGNSMCHYVITDGEINYCDDCTPGTLRGKHPLQDIPQDKYDKYGIFP